MDVWQPSSSKRKLLTQLEIQTKIPVEVAFILSPPIEICQQRCHLRSRRAMRAFWGAPCEALREEPLLVAAAAAPLTPAFSTRERRTTKAAVCLCL